MLGRYSNRGKARQNDDDCSVLHKSNNNNNNNNETSNDDDDGSEQNIEGLALLSSSSAVTATDDDDDNNNNRQSISFEVEKNMMIVDNKNRTTMVLTNFVSSWWNRNMSGIFTLRSLCLSLVYCFFIIIILWSPPQQEQQLHSSSNNNASSSPYHSDNNDYYVRYDKIIGLLHIAKTAGTEINGILASRYERICGQNGYSYDAFQFNKRASQRAGGRNGHLSIQHAAGDNGDLISKQYNNENNNDTTSTTNDYNRGNVPLSVMEEIGYEDCDVISVQADWTYWTNLFLQQQKQQQILWSMELHVPCREPLNHLMSQCNYLGIQFECHDPNKDNNDTNSTNNQYHYLKSQIEQCMVESNRFHRNLTLFVNEKENNNTIQLKCFNPLPIDTYIEYMGSTILQQKRIETTYIHRSTNQDRDKEQECIWKNENEHIANQVRDILFEKDYYHWCNECIGTTNDLLNMSFEEQDWLSARGN